jgi:hypothetical protein
MARSRSAGLGRGFSCVAPGAADDRDSSEGVATAAVARRVGVHRDDFPFAGLLRQPDAAKTNPEPRHEEGGAFAKTSAGPTPALPPVCARRATFRGTFVEPGLQTIGRLVNLGKSIPRLPALGSLCRSGLP